MPLLQHLHFQLMFTVGEYERFNFHRLSINKFLITQFTSTKQALTSYNGLGSDGLVPEPLIG